MPEFTRNYTNAQPQIPNYTNKQTQIQIPKTQIPNAQIPNAQNRNNRTNQSNQTNQTNQDNRIYLEQSRTKKEEPNQNNLANYYNHNFDTLNNNTQKNINNMDFLNVDKFNNLNNNIISQKNSTQDTHSGGLQMINPRNMYSMGNYEELPNKYNESGYNKVEEKKIDYRQSMNNKLDNFIFNNPNAIASEPNPILTQAKMNNQHYGNSKDTRMVIQDSSKDYYRQSANDRMSQYSPLSRASNMPISIASMSVNDFYSNMQNNQSQSQTQTQPNNQLSNKDTMNARIDNYTPLAKNILQSQHPQMQKTETQQQPPIWNPIDNINGKLNNVVFKDLPINSNFNVSR